MLTAPRMSADAWHGATLQSDPCWRIVLGDAEREELAAALRAARATGRPMLALTRDDFPLPTLAARIEGWVDELRHGRGFVLVKGMPVGRLDESDCAWTYWGIGLHMGRAVPQNTDGDLLGHVRDTGEDPERRGVRLYKTRAEQDFHVDGAAMVGLFCLRPARSGGISRIASSTAIYNEMALRAPELIATLYTRFPFDRQGQENPGERPWFEAPLCRLAGARLETFFIPWYIRESQQHPAAPRLTDAQWRCVEFFEQTANDPRFYLDMNFEPGDIQFLNNASILHKRTAYEDWDAPELKRHLLRLWLSVYS